MLSVLQGRVLGQLLSLLYTFKMFSILENKLIGYADDSMLMAVVPSSVVSYSSKVPFLLLVSITNEKIM